MVGPFWKNTETLMNFFERRKQEKELERKIKIKEGRRRIERNIDKQKKPNTIYAIR